MAAWSDLLGEGSSAQQFLLWGIGYALAQQLLEPVLEALGQELWQAAVEGSGGEVHRVLSPADLAQAVVRNFEDRGAAAGSAAQSGMTAGDFDTLVALAGDAPGPDELAVALRRQLIPEDGTGVASTSFTQGIAEGRLNDKWAPVIKELATIWPTPNDALDALLEGQIDPTTAAQLYQKFGGDPDFFDLLYNTRGNAPTPMEALTMLNRGLIPESGTGPDSISYEQAFLEGPWRNKWLTPFRGLGTYVVPPRSVVAMVRAGSFTAEQATAELAKSGVSADVAAAILKEAGTSRTTANKGVAKTEVLTLYEVQAINTEQATAYLDKLGYTADEITLELSYVDFGREAKALNSAVTRVGTLYVAHKITRQAAATALGVLGVQGDHAANMLTTWDTERQLNVRQLTEAQIAKAMKLGNMTQGEATAELVAIGYTPFDAWQILSNEMDATLPGKPAQGPAGPGLLP